MLVPQGNTAMGFYGLLRGQFYFLYVNDVGTSQETHLQSSTAFCRDIFTYLYIDDVLTSQETHLWPPRPLRR
jgi:hypothetical protein